MAEVVIGGRTSVLRSPLVAGSYSADNTNIPSECGSVPNHVSKPVGREVELLETLKVTKLFRDFPWGAKTNHNRVKRGFRPELEVTAVFCFLFEFANSTDCLA